MIGALLIVLQLGAAVPRSAFMPAALVEIGFGTDSAEAAYLSDSARQTAIAGAIADAAMEYLLGYESRVKSGRRASRGREPSR